MVDEVTVTTSVPAATFSDIGLSVPDEKDILDGRLSDLDDAPGGGMSKSLTTPQGQIAMSEAAIIAASNDQKLAIINGINPDYSTGRFQDAIGRIYFMDRISAQGTTVTATATGLVGTIIPAGSTAQDDAGYIYTSLSSATITSSGSVDIIFRNNTTGPMPCPVGSLNTIYRAISGWSGVYNNASGVVGVDVESRSAFELRRQKSVAINGRNTDASTLSALLSTDGVWMLMCGRTGKITPLTRVRLSIRSSDTLSLFACMAELARILLMRYTERRTTALTLMVTRHLSLKTKRTTAHPIRNTPCSGKRLNLYGYISG